MSGPRILAIMGSGETAPAMAKVHRDLFRRLGDGPARAVLIDTPYGFQENADELSARIVEYFRDRVGQPMAVASLRSNRVDQLAAATALARVGDARYVMAGPGSPSYALAHWAGGPIPDSLAAKLRQGGVVTMASAAALTLGLVTIPVYEIYKVGAEPSWLPGLDILGAATGLRAAVVPHYDNAEGGTHDTRFCYIGERRLRVLEETLPVGAFILGVDGHTALILDLESGTADVTGLGGVTVRVAGRSVVFPRRTRTTIDALRDAAGSSTGPPVPDDASLRPGGPEEDDEVSAEQTVLEALDEHDPPGIVAALLELNAAIETRLRAGVHGPDLDRTRDRYRALLVRLGERAAGPSIPPQEALGPLVSTLVELRAQARAAGDWDAADLIRDRLAAAGIEVHDEGEASRWLVKEPGGR